MVALRLVLQLVDDVDHASPQIPRAEIPAIDHTVEVDRRLPRGVGAVSRDHAGCDPLGDIVSQQHFARNARTGEGAVLPRRSSVLMRFGVEEPVFHDALPNVAVQGPVSRRSAGWLNKGRTKCRRRKLLLRRFAAF
jgi:hypothetical protein